MWVWVLKDSEKRMSRMSYNRNSYPHASVFYSEEDADKAVQYFGGTWYYSKVWLDV